MKSGWPTLIHVYNTQDSSGITIRFILSYVSLILVEITSTGHPVQSLCEASLATNEFLTISQLHGKSKLNHT